MLLYEVKANYKSSGEKKSEDSTYKKGCKAFILEKLILYIYQSKLKFQ